MSEPMDLQLAREISRSDSPNIWSNDKRQAALRFALQQVERLTRELAVVHTRIACLETMAGDKAIETLNDFAEAQAQLVASGPRAAALLDKGSSVAAPLLRRPR